MTTSSSHPTFSCGQCVPGPLPRAVARTASSPPAPAASLRAAPALLASAKAGRTERRGRRALPHSVIPHKAQHAFPAAGQQRCRAPPGTQRVLSDTRWPQHRRGAWRSPAQTQLTRRAQSSAVPSGMSRRHVQPLPRARAPLPPLLPARTPAAPGDTPEARASGFDCSIWKGFRINHVYCARAEPRVTAYL